MPATPPADSTGTGGRPYEQIVIEALTPSSGNSRYPIKAVIGGACTVEATVFRHGHERLRAVLRTTTPSGRSLDTSMTLVNPGLDRWRAVVPLEELGRYRLHVVAWTDVYASWVEELGKRVRAAQPDIASEIAEGLALVQAVVDSTRDAAVEALGRTLRAAAADANHLLSVASSADALSVMGSAGPRHDEARSDDLIIAAEREQAAVGAWYELFVRSETTVPGRHGTFRDAESRLEDIRQMGFDVLYLAPIHPIGLTNRKGRNNRTTAEPGDPGSPWAIGNMHGGHTAIEPALGSLDDFDRFVRRAADLGMEIALDFAVQCSPDHPWVRLHPDWFSRRPDGTIRFAENPPKKYEDIYPLNFDTPDWRGLWEALRDVILFWVGRGVRIFRVDNPHTKPIGFWTWLIDTVQTSHPDVVFLAEAFTRPPMVQALARRGFTQSYTYFTWRNTKRELTEYLTELTAPETAAFLRPNFFANTPDILPPILQTGGPPAFTTRFVLAATLSPVYGIYNGFELCENAAIPGREEYLDSEKYEIKVRDWHRTPNLRDVITRVNAARRRYAALRHLSNLRFLDIDDDHLIAYVKTAPDGSHPVIVVVNLDPFARHTSVVDVPPDAVGVREGDVYDVLDVLTDRAYTWRQRNYVSLDPIDGESAHVFIVNPGQA